LQQTVTNEEENAGQNMSEEWRKFELRSKISGGEYLRVYLEELCLNGKTV
jgi:predicted SprT family Zn-dependent metalloprotease